MTDSILEYRKGYDFQCVRDFTVFVGIKGYEIETDYLKLTKRGLLTIKRNYACDGPSGPTFDSRSSIRASFIHDALYWLMRNGYISKDHKGLADDVFYDFLILDGMNCIRAWLWWNGVNRRGKNSLYPSTEKPILRAP